jgi:WD40 repeat protein
MKSASVRFGAFLLLCASAQIGSAGTTLKCRFELGKGFLVRKLVFSPNGRLLAVASGSDRDHGDIRLFSLEKAAVVARLAGHDDAVNALAFSPDGKLLASGGTDGKCILWDTNTWKRVAEVHGHDDAIIDLAMSPTGKQLATSSRDRAIALWDVPALEPSATLRVAGGSAVRLAYTTDGKLVAGTSDGQIRIWEIGTRKEVLSWQAHEKAVHALVPSPVHKRIATCSEDGFVKTWDTQYERERKRWDMGHDEPLSLAIAPNGKLLAAGSAGGEVVFHNLSAYVVATPGQSLVPSKISFPLHKCAVITLAFSPDGKLLASGSLDTTVSVLADLPAVTPEVVPPDAAKKVSAGMTLDQVRAALNGPGEFCSEETEFSARGTITKDTLRYGWRFGTRILLVGFAAKRDADGKLARDAEGDPVPDRVTGETEWISEDE